MLAELGSSEAGEMRRVGIGQAGPLGFAGLCHGHAARNWIAERRIGDIPIAIPPKSSNEETPRDPKDSTLPYPLGKRSVGGFKAQDTVANVIMSDTMSVNAWNASATYCLQLAS